MLEFRTTGFNGSSTQYSPFIDSRLAVASSANFGLVGNGRLYILNLTADGILLEKHFDTQDALYDVAWSEAHDQQLVVGSGDGSIKLFDLTLDQFPVRAWHEHTREVFSVHWNLVSKQTFCSSSWDGTVKIWSPVRPTSSLLTLPTHSCTYSAAWSPHADQVLSCVSSDSHLRLYDLRTPASASHHLTLCIPIHQTAPRAAAAAAASPPPPAPAEALTHDWNKYRPSVVATAGVDRLIRSFDLRSPTHGPVAVLAGHDYAVRKLAWSPHRADVLLSAGYDMSARVWTDGAGGAGGLAAPPRELGRMDAHTEFVTGLDWCLFGAEGWAATVGWDERVLVWDVRAVM
ncbi:MAG: peroxisomal targeting signal 2 receptor [Phylliscum demangeonii]|nr:MAG: peroxisomal targeting signal 2 receptor [Phylliscum demangeonii]